MKVENIGLDNGNAWCIVFVHETMEGKRGMLSSPFITLALAIHHARWSHRNNFAIKPYDKKSITSACDVLQCSMPTLPKAGLDFNTGKLVPYEWE
jgi:hypothetical protein